MIKKFSLIALTFLLISAPVLVVRAQEEEKVVVQQVNSFELFWPLVAGRTSEDSLYPIKRVKEKVRGLLIFGQAQKADYSLFLGTKRMLEVEKLLSEGKQDKAKSTLKEALEEFQRVESISSSEVSFGDLVHTMNQRIDNLIILTESLTQSNQEISDKLDQVKQTLEAATSQI